jgi:hypothetical protein
MKTTMKIIEAMKLIKELAVKRDDLTNKVKTHCAYLSHETPLYKDQPAQVSEWLQSIGDICKKILELRLAIQRTNLHTEVTIELDGKPVTKTIAEWIHRRRDLAGFELAAWSGLTDRGLREGRIPSSQPNGQPIEVKLIRCFDPLERDKKIELFRSEPSIIDRTLEVANATTDLIP